jgi:Flp pilus assembly protein TadD
LRKTDVIDYLRCTPTIDSQVRHVSLDRAEQHPEETDPRLYYAAAWPVIRHPYANAFACRFARAQMAAACERAPDDGQYRIALAVAQYRLGRFQKGHYAEALATLAKCDPSQPTTLAFLAMTEHCVGQNEQARTTLGRLREIMKKPNWPCNADAAAFLHEAEVLIEAVAKSP